MELAWSSIDYLCARTVRVGAICAVGSSSIGSTAVQAGPIAVAIEVGSSSVRAWNLCYWDDRRRLELVLWRRIQQTLLQSLYTMSASSAQKVEVRNYTQFVDSQVRATGVLIHTLISVNHRDLSKHM